MKVALLSYGTAGPETLGTLWLEGEQLQADTPFAQDIAAGLTQYQPKVLRPGTPTRWLVPADGEDFLRALPHAFRTPYLLATLIEEE